jgi:hypothetical protein
MRLLSVCVLLLLGCVCLRAQEPASGSNERRVALTENAVALDGSGGSALEATLKTTALNGAEDSPVTNILMVVRNSSSVAYGFVSGLVTFYDSAGVRCGEGLFKADALAVDEAFETDAPGIRIRCAPTSWRIVVNSLVPRVMSPIAAQITMTGRANPRLVINVDGEEHPIQIDKPMVLTFGQRQRTIVLREAP